MSALEDVRGLKLPDWYVGGGAIRNTVWDYLHDYPTTSNQNDVDVVYFDINDMEGKKEKTSEQFLKIKSPNLKWEVVNQARAHLFEHLPGSTFRRPAVKSSCESTAYWSETATCVSVRLETDGNLTVCAPHGLDDLMNLIVRPVPKPYQDLFLYNQRMKDKKWNKFWPKLKIYNKN